jgi:MYXO-CTERM domain-containing protein
MFGNDFIGATIAPDGTPWGSYTQDCGPSRSSPGCEAQDDETRGFAGRLAFAQPKRVVAEQPEDTPDRSPLATTGAPYAIGFVALGLLGLAVVLRRSHRVR